MAKQIKINQYKKLKNLTLSFDSGLNAISGVNGTCKSSILHIISNAYQAVQLNDQRLIDSSGLKSITGLNAQTNEKIEKLARGDREYNDPAPGLKGALFEVVYDDGSTLSFRRHNSRHAGRYAVKPRYSANSSESLPALPVVYLSLARLLPFGEYQDDSSLIKPRTSFPASYREYLTSLYEQVTGIKAEGFTAQKMGTVKSRQEFNTAKEGIDSNTISSGEDNLVVLLSALVSLKHYYDCLTNEAKTAEVCSVLLIDEFDATLHPSYQYSMLDIVEKYSADNKIQVIFTTHSLVLLNYMFKKRQNVIYLMDNLSMVEIMPDPDPDKIELFLKAKTRAEVLSDRIIPVFTEDEEARLFCRIILEKLAGNSSGFARFLRDAHMIDANFGAEELMKLFSDRKVRQSSMASICILDGDHNSNLTCNIVALPHKNRSPEIVAFEFAKLLADEPGNPFWIAEETVANGFGVSFFTRTVLPEIEKAQAQEKDKKRTAVKKVFNNNLLFFEYVLKAWTSDPRSAKAIRRFASDVEALYRKTAVYHEIFIPSTETFKAIPVQS